MVTRKRNGDSDDARDAAQVRQRAKLPCYVLFRLHDDGSASMAFMCTCGEAMAREVSVHVDEGGSSSETECPACHRCIQVRASRVM